MSDSNVQPMEWRPQTGVQLPHTTHGTSTLPNDDRHNDAKYDLLAIKVLTSSGVSAMKSDGEQMNALLQLTS